MKSNLCTKHEISNGIPECLTANQERLINAGVLSVGLVTLPADTGDDMVIQRVLFTCMNGEESRAVAELVTLIAHCGEKLDKRFPSRPFNYADFLHSGMGNIDATIHWVWTYEGWLGYQNLPELNLIFTQQPENREMMGIIMLAEQCPQASQQELCDKIVPGLSQTLCRVGLFVPAAYLQGGEDVEEEDGGFVYVKRLGVSTKQAKEVAIACLTTCGISVEEDDGNVYEYSDVIAGEVSTADNAILWMYYNVPTIPVEVFQDDM